MDTWDELYPSLPRIHLAIRRDYDQHHWEFDEVLQNHHFHLLVLYTFFKIFIQILNFFFDCGRKRSRQIFPKNERIASWVQRLHSMQHARLLPAWAHGTSSVGSTVDCYAENVSKVDVFFKGHKIQKQIFPTFWQLPSLIPLRKFWISYMWVFLVFVILITYVIFL